MKKIIEYYRAYSFRINLLLLPMVLFSLFLYNYGEKNNWQLADFILGNIDIDSPYYDSFLTIIQITIAWIVCVTAIYFNAKQIEKQKDNIKLQMFEKRYKVFEAITEAKTLVNRDDHVLIGITQCGYFENLGVRINDSFENLRRQTTLSQALYSDAIFQKIKKIQHLYQKAIYEYRQLPINGAKMMNELPPEKIQSIQKIFISYAKDPAKIKEELDKIIPEFSASLINWSNAVDEFNNYIDKCDIMKDFDGYIKIENIDK